MIHPHPTGRQAVLRRAQAVLRRAVQGACAGTLLLFAAGCDDASMAHQPKRNAYASAATGPGPVPDGQVEWREPAAPAAPPLTPVLLQRGQDVYRQICVPCHSELGDGHGMVVQRGLSPPPSYHIARLREAPTQHFYDVITQGYGAMYSYAQRVSPRDRWAIAAYIRALQRSTSGSLTDLSPADRQALPSADGASPRTESEPSRAAEREASR